MPMEMEIIWFSFCNFNKCASRIVSHFLKRGIECRDLDTLCNMCENVFKMTQNAINFNEMQKFFSVNQRLDSFFGFYYEKCIMVEMKSREMRVLSTSFLYYVSYP